MKILPPLLVLLVITALAQHSPAPASRVVLKPNGYSRAENGLFALVGDTLCSYSSSRGAATARQCYTLTDGEWTAKGSQRPGTAAPAEYLDFAPCDPLNQLSIGVQHSEIAALLPQSAALKQVTAIAHFDLAVYSESRAETVRYPLHLAVLLERDGKVERAADVSLGGDGNYCGMRVIAQRNSAVILLYIDEPAGSSDYAAIRSYLLSWAGE